jgi:hypothetical protein
MLDWTHVSERMSAARIYWIATVSPDRRPHTIPIWAVWLDDVFYFGGGLKTRHMRNVQQRPVMTAHLESGDDVVIVEGDVEQVTDPDLLRRLDRAGKEKYGLPYDPDAPASTEPVFALRPRKAFAWTRDLRTATRWVFSR